MPNILQVIQLILAIITGGFSLLVMLCTPFRNWILNRKKAAKAELDEKEKNKETDRCILRNMITEIYYHNFEKREIEIYEYENAAYLYTQYKKLDGNSFIDIIWAEMQEWKVLK